MESYVGGCSISCPKFFEEILIFKIKPEMGCKILTSGCNVYGDKFSWARTSKTRLMNCVKRIEFRYQFASALSFALLHFKAIFKKFSLTHMHARSKPTIDQISTLS